MFVPVVHWAIRAAVTTPRCATVAVGPEQRKEGGRVECTGDKPDYLSFPPPNYGNGSIFFS